MPRLRVTPSEGRSRDDDPLRRRPDVTAPTFLEVLEEINSTMVER
jgi:hypothetical protein